MTSIAVRGDERGHGHARRLHVAFVQLARTRGATRIKAITTPENEASIAFHRSMGMTAREVADYSGPGKARVVLERELGPDPR